MGEEEEREIGLFRSPSLSKIPLSPWFCDSELWFFFSLPTNQFLNTIFLFLFFSSFRLHKIHHVRGACVLPIFPMSIHKSLNQFLTLR